MFYQPWSHWTRWCASHNHQLQYLSKSKTTSNSCCINLGLTGPDGVQVTIISYNIYQTLKSLLTRAVNLGLTGPDGVQLHLGVNVFTTKVLIVDTIFTSLTGDGTAILRGHRSQAKVQPLEVRRDYLHFSVIFKRPWVLVQLLETNPRPPALQSCALPTEVIQPVLCETQNNEIQNIYTEILLQSTDECQPLDALKSSTTL